MIKGIVFLLLFLVPIHASLNLNAFRQITNVEIGGIFPLMGFSLSDDIFFNLTHRPYSSYNAGLFIFDTVYIGAESYTVHINPHSISNVISLGWYASVHAAITVTSMEIFPYKKPKMLLGTGLNVSSSFRGTMSLLLPNSTLIFISTQLLFHDGNASLFLPLELVPAIDRTVATVYTIPALSLSIDTLHAGSTYTIQTWNESFVGIGTNMKQKLALVVENASSYTVWGFYDERTHYNPEIQIYIAFLTIIALTWYLVVVNFDESAFRSNHDHYDLRSILLSYAGVLLCIGVISRELLVYDLFVRMQYVTEVNVFELGLLVASTVAVLAVVHIYTTWNIHLQFELRRASFDTLLALAVASIFVGRTEVCEETVLCFVIALMWTPFQLMSIVRCPNWGRLVLLIFFVLIYPLVAILLVEPLVATVPEFVSVTWPSSQMIMFLPPLLLLGLWTVLPW